MLMAIIQGLALGLAIVGGMAMAYVVGRFLIGE